MKKLTVTLFALVMMSCASLQNKVEDIANDMPCSDICVMVNAVGAQYWGEDESCADWCEFAKQHIDVPCVVDSVKKQAENIDKCIK